MEVVGVQESSKNSIDCFLEGTARLVRNLIDEDDRLDDVRASWDSLHRLLDPTWFKHDSDLRSSVSLARGGLIREARRNGKTREPLRFAQKVELDDLIALSRTEMRLAAARAAINTIEMLLDPRELNANINQTILELERHFNDGSKEGTSLLILALEEDCLEYAKRYQCIRRTSLAKIRHQGWPFLTCSVMLGQERFVDWLLDSGINPNPEPGDKKHSALFLASSRGNNRIVHRLIAAGADVNHSFADKVGTALVGAICGGNREAVSQLLEAGCSVGSDITCRGMTPLMAASIVGDPTIVQSLLAYGAEPNQTSGIEREILAISAVREGHSSIILPLLIPTDLEKDLESNRLLGCEVAEEQSVVNRGMTPLVAAAMLGNELVLKELSVAGASIDLATPIEGKVLLLAACKANNQVLVSKTLKVGAFIDQCASEEKYTALLAACLVGESRSTQAIIELDACLDFHIDSQDTALILASSEGHSEIVNQLIEAGASIDLTTAESGWPALFHAVDLPPALGPV